MNQLKKLFAVAALTACVLPVAAQYPVIPDSVKIRGEEQQKEISCKDEDGLKQFVNDHEGTIFAEEDSQEMVMLCFRHSDMRISPEEWEKMDCPVSMREIYGQMQEVKIVKDHKTHLTTFYY